MNFFSVLGRSSSLFGLHSRGFADFAPPLATLPYLRPSLSLGTTSYLRPVHQSFRSFTDSRNFSLFSPSYLFLRLFYIWPGLIDRLRYHCGQTRHFKKYRPVRPKPLRHFCTEYMGTSTTTVLVENYGLISHYYY